MPGQRVAVVGGGNAALCAAISARENGADVDLFERAPFDLRGGNSRFTAGAIRTTYNGVEQIRELMPDLTDDEIENTEFGEYSEADFFDDLGRVTQYRTDPDLAELLVKQSFPTLRWMRQHGVRFLPLYGRQSFEIDGKRRFWGGLTVEAWGGGQGLIDQLTQIATTLGVEIHYESRITHIDRNISGFELSINGKTSRSFDSVVLACGGFESSAEMRARYLGPNWDLAKVRGTKFNTGDGIRMAQELGAATTGHWSGCHAVAWDLNAPMFGDLAVGDGFQKHSYPFGIVVNANGDRFLDEGADFRNYTYAKYGSEILKQPNHLAWQVFDQKVTHLLRDEYRIREVTKVSAGTLEELGERMNGVDARAFVRSVQAYNAAVEESMPFDPTVKDGRCTNGLSVNKSNWANRLDSPPFEAYGVTCGITFTFGGLEVDAETSVLDEQGDQIEGLYAAGEMVGGLYYHNYPGGSGLMAGAVFGRKAGMNATSV
ncbi:MAG: FAD-dependent tricarballylate dehydrogenase TcuA [Gammaproteobacteria bacterium]|nr:FAD-dependent tricarballylate dehydrogenase TcuA [Gammaproteobacteria bacterium]